MSTKIVLISDTHGRHDKLTLPDGELLIHSGDFSSYGSRSDTRDFLEWYQAQPHPLKVLISGNHDALPFQHKDLFKWMLNKYAPDVHYLEDSEVNLAGLTIYGMPWTPRFLNWSFMSDRGADMQRNTDKIPEDIDILVTHGPMFGVMDLSQNWNSETGSKCKDHLGCRDLYERILEVEPILHTCGHIHGSGGNRHDLISDQGHKTICVNASVMDEDYKLTHNPVVIELP